MDRKNILTEIKLINIFKVFKFLKKSQSKTKNIPLKDKEKQLLKNPAVAAALADFEKTVAKVSKQIKKTGKKYGVDVKTAKELGL